MLHGVVVLCCAFSQRLAGLDVVRREQPLAVFHGQTLCPVGRDPPHEVLKLALQRDADAVKETARLVRVVDAVI